MKKRVFIIIIMAIVAFIIGYHYPKNDKLVKKGNETLSQYLFQKKQECASYRNNIEKLLEKEKRMMSVNTLDEIFYIPSENSCLYSYITYYLTADGKDLSSALGKDYVIRDYFTNDIVVKGNSYVNSDIAHFFYVRKAELKK